jgi:hypothetical protein
MSKKRLADGTEIDKKTKHDDEFYPVFFVSDQAKNQPKHQH